MVYENIKDLMTGICDAVRTKEGSSDLIPHQELPKRIANISGGNSSDNEVTYEARYKITTVSIGGTDASIKVVNLINNETTEILFTSVSNSQYVDFGEFKISYDTSRTSWKLTCNTNMLLVNSHVIFQNESLYWRYNESIEYDVKIRVVNISNIIPHDPYKYLITTSSTSGHEAAITVDNLVNGATTVIPYKNVENGSYADFGDFKISYSAAGWCLECTTDRLYINDKVVINNGDKKYWKYSESVEYYISLNSPEILPLYNKGDECTNITGGWDSTFTTEKWSSANGNTLTTRPIVKNIDNIFINPTNTFSLYPMNTVNKIDFTSYNTLYIEMAIDAVPYHIGIQIISDLTGNYSMDEGSMPEQNVKTFCIANKNTGNYLKKHYIDIEDISDISGEYYIALYDLRGSSTDPCGETYIKKIWLSQ